VSAEHPPGQGLAIGQILNERYRVESELGRGGMAIVYLAVDLRLTQRKVVIKIPRAEVLADARMRQRFLAEVRDLSQYEHPNILTIIDFGEHQGVPFAVLQYLGGGDLGDRLRDSPTGQPLGEILAWLHPIAHALDYIHSKGCLHRDVKTGNILFDDQGHPYLSDFGIATAIDVMGAIDSEAPTLQPEDQLTTVGSFVGSPAYAPPEAIDRTFTPAYDQYSLATVVYLALCKHLPFEGRTAEAILIAKANTPPTPLPANMPDRAVPAGCGRVLLQALARDPAERFESCEAFANAFASEAGAQSRRVGYERIVVAAGLLALLGVVAVVASRWPTSNDTDSEGAIGSIGTIGTMAELGSTQQERADALALCEQHYGFCDRAEFEGEDVRVHTVTAVEVDRREITNAEFDTFASRTGRLTLAERKGSSWDGPTRVSGLSWRKPVADRAAAEQLGWPVVHIAFEEASSYCAELGKRLPTADEWEYVARGAARRTFPWGDAWDEARLRFGKRTGIGLETVGSHPSGATPEGVEDLAGSVWEWTSDLRDGERVIKGASWDSRNPAHFRAAAFALVDAEHTSAQLGFRCLRDR
jgi:formylglycine-generating enzyme required for sulfatase activity/tRNA A-37 threonylcarbamoyl transferase component Bud32